MSENLFTVQKTYEALVTPDTPEGKKLQFDETRIFKTEYDRQMHLAGLKGMDIDAAIVWLEKPENKGVDNAAAMLDLLKRKKAELHNIQQKTRKDLSKYATVIDALIPTEEWKEHTAKKTVSFKDGKDAKTYPVFVRESYEGGMDLEIRDSGVATRITGVPANMVSAVLSSYETANNPNAAAMLKPLQDSFLAGTVKYEDIKNIVVPIESTVKPVVKPAPETPVASTSPKPQEKQDSKKPEVVQKPKKPEVSRAPRFTLDKDGNILRNGKLFTGTIDTKVPVLLSHGKYSGEVKEGKLEWKGIVVFKTGDRYEGDFKNDIMEWNGIYTYKDDGRYEGEYKEGTRGWKGIYFFKSGNIWNGEWKKGDFHSGTKVDKDGKVLETWKDGKLVEPPKAAPEKKKTKNERIDDYLASEGFVKNADGKYLSKDKDLTLSIQDGKVDFSRSIGRTFGSWELNTTEKRWVAEVAKILAEK